MSANPADEPWVDDLTSDQTLNGSFFALTSSCVYDDVVPCSCKVFDMTYSDDDNAWTCDDSDVQHVRTVEIILDSGADGSALPLDYAAVGTSHCPDQRMRFVDAQGSPLNISSTRIATVDFGDFCLKEEFIVASITSPLISLGKLMKHGWSLKELGHGLHLGSQTR